MALVGRQILKFFGWTPTTDGKEPAEDGSNLMRIEARSLIGSPKKRPNEASLETIEAGNSAQSINAMDKIAIYAAFVSGLPINNFIISKSVASSATLRQGEADINALHRLLGRSWSQVFELFRLMELLYGDTQFAPSAVRPIWVPPETVNVEARTEEARAQKDTGVPVEFIWRHVWGSARKKWMLCRRRWRPWPLKRQPMTEPKVAPRQPMLRPIRPPPREPTAAAEQQQNRQNNQSLLRRISMHIGSRSQARKRTNRFKQRLN